MDDAISISESLPPQIIIDNGIPRIKCLKCRKIPFIYLLSKSSIIYECAFCKIVKKFSIKSLLDRSSELTCNSSPPCQVHNTPSVKQCLTCNQNFCIKCLEAHNLLFKNHKLIDSDVNLNLMCNIHNSRTTRYCETCYNEICEKCEQGSDHKEHKIIVIDSLFNNNLNKIISNIKENYAKITSIVSKENLNKKDNFIKEIEDEILRFENEYKQNLQNIEKESKEKIENYQLQIKEIEQKIKDELLDKEAKILNEKENIDKLKKNLENKKLNMNKIFDINKEENNLLLKFFNTILENFNSFDGKNNYNSIQTLVQNSKFNFSNENDILNYNVNKDNENKNNDINNDLFDEKISDSLRLKYKKLIKYFQNYLIISSENPFNFNTSENDELNVKIDSQNFCNYSLLLANIERNENDNINNRKIIYCPQCFEIPVLRILDQSNLLIFCRKCKFNKIYKIKYVLENYENDNFWLGRPEVVFCSNKLEESHTGVPSTTQCLQCEKYFCNSHLKHHNFTFNNHSLLPYYLKIFLKCKTHNIFYSSYCKICNTSLCIECMQMDVHNNHKEHIISLKDVFEEENLDIIKLNIDIFKENSDSANTQMKKELFERIESVKENLIKTCDKNIKSINDKADLLIQNYTEEIKKNQRFIDEANNIKKISIDVEEKNKNQLLSQCEDNKKLINEKFEKNKSDNEHLYELFKIIISNYKYCDGKYIYYLSYNILNNNYVGFNEPEKNENINDDQSTNILSYEIVRKDIANILNSASFFDKNFFIDFSKIFINFEENSENNKFKNLLSIKKHNSKINSLILLSDGRLASCSEDNSIIIYDKDTYDQETKIYKPHKGDKIFSKVYPPYSICQLDNGYLVSCSFCNIRIFDISRDNDNNNDYKVISSIDNAHTDQILKVIPLTKKRFASCSKDKMIKIWNYENYENCQTILSFECHQDSVFTLYQLSNGVLVSGGKDKNLMFLDADNATVIHIHPNIELASPNSLYEDKKNKKLIVGCNKNITVIDIDNVETINVFNDNLFGGITCFTSLRDESILCGNDKGEIILLENDYKLKQKRKIQDKSLSNLIAIDDNKLIACGSGYEIKLFEY